MCCATSKKQKIKFSKRVKKIKMNCRSKIQQSHVGLTDWLLTCDYYLDLYYNAYTYVCMICLNIKVSTPRIVDCRLYIWSLTSSFFNCRVSYCVYSTVCYYNVHYYNVMYCIVLVWNAGERITSMVRFILSLIHKCGRGQKQLSEPRNFERDISVYCVSPFRRNIKKLWLIFCLVHLCGGL